MNIDILNKYSIKKYIDVINDLDISKLLEFRENLDNLYYNTGDFVLSDERYDIITERISELCPESNYKVGSKIRSDDIDAKLPIWLGSLDTLKPDKEAKIHDWFKKHSTDEYVIEDKLDGTSCLVQYDSENNIKMYTRGNGKIGKDISYLSKHITSIPTMVPKKYNSILIRGELIIRNDTFEEKYVDKYQTVRAMVPGILRSKEFIESMNDIEFVAYEIIDGTREEQLKPSEQIKLLKMLKFNVVNNAIVNKSDIYDKIVIDNLHIYLNDFKKNSEFNIDGIVIHQNKCYKRNSVRNPGYSFAYKEDSEIAYAKVTDIEWNLSRHGYYKPTVLIEETRLMNTNVKRLTGFNAAYIRKNSLGPGAHIKITKSGEVIPFILETIKPSSDGPKMPDDKNVYWDENNIELIVTDNMNDSVSIKRILFFFKTMGTKFMGESTIERLYNAKYDSIHKILSITKPELMNIDGIQSQSADRIIKNIKESIEKTSISQLLAASGCFQRGLGEKKIQLVFETYPDILTRDDAAECLIKVVGFSKKSVEIFMNGIDKANDFLKEISFENFGMNNRKAEIKDETISTQNTNLKDKIIVLSGFRDKDFEKRIENNGGKISNTVSNKTHVVVTTDINGKSTKINKAKSLNIEIILKEKFIVENL